jgi:Tol biopolymer transport system component
LGVAASDPLSLNHYFGISKATKCNIFFRTITVVVTLLLFSEIASLSILPMPSSSLGLKTSYNRNNAYADLSNVVTSHRIASDVAVPGSQKGCDLLIETMDINDPDSQPTKIPGSECVVHPSFSADGKKIVFHKPVYENSEFTTGFEIFVENVDGSNLLSLTNKNYTDYDNFLPHTTSTQSALPSFSPDGKKIVFQRRDENQHSEIYVMNADGSGIVRLTQYYEDDTFPSFSPDGKKILFQRGSIISTMNTDGSSVASFVQAYYASYSPDGKKIVFSHLSDGGGSDIYAMNAADGSQMKRLTNDTSFQSTVAWSPDGKKIVYGTNGFHDLAIMNEDGSDQQLLTHNVESGKKPLPTYFWITWVPVPTSNPPPDTEPPSVPEPPITGDRVIATSGDDGTSSCISQLSGHGAKIVWNSSSVTCTIESGTLEISHSASLTIGSGGSDSGNSSPFTLEIANSAVLQNQGTLSNVGRIKISDGGRLSNTGTISNSGIIVNSKQGTVENQGTLSNSDMIDNYGVINNGGNKTNVARLINSGYLNSNGLGGKIVTSLTGAVVNSGYMC